MKTQPTLKRLLVVAFVLAFAELVPAAYAQVPNIPGVPPISTTTQTPFQQQTHFLTFLGSYIPESSATATAYYNAVDPTASKRTFTKWLVNAGFIANESQWHPYGAQDIRTGQPAGVYGDNIINTDSHVIVLNAADLGFVRNQFVRCKPSCTALNPIIYTYLENYPVAPFAAGGSGFPTLTGYPTQAEASAAIASAINRPLGDEGGDGVSPCTSSSTCIERIADVAFEWAPPADGKSPNTRYGQLYAYVFSHDAVNGILETIAAAPGQVGQPIPDFFNPNGPFLTINAGDPFPPNLDGQGFKQHPGVCFICHGGKPTNLVGGVYPRKGKVDGFRLLPLDNRNLMFGDGSFSLANQEPQIKRYNQVVLKTVPILPERDDQGVARVPHLAEVIRGWYAGFDGDLTMSSPTQNGSFIPKGWREPAHGGTAKAGSEQLYLNTVAPSCRSCHFNRELSLDFGTVANFDQESDLLQLALLPECQANNPDPKKRPMPLALLTFQRLWEAQNSPRTLSDGSTISNTITQLKSHFGFTPTGYCASNP